MTTKHTPGPWHSQGVAFYTAAPKLDSVGFCDYGNTGSAVSTESEATANAQLCAAAPCLLAALQAVSEYLNNVITFSADLDIDGKTDSSAVALVEQARAAIARAVAP